MVSTLMEFVNALAERQRAGAWRTATFHRALEHLLVLLAPAAPFVAEELWRQTGHKDSVHRQPWPAWDPELARDELAQVAIQVDGRLREVVEAALDASEDEVRALALARPKVQQHLEGKPVKQVFFVPGKILNIVTRGKSFAP